MRATPNREMESSRLPVAIEKMVTLKAHAMEKYAAQEEKESIIDTEKALFTLIV